MIPGELVYLDPLKTLILGIDPGLTGAAAIYNRDSKLLVDLFDLPSEYKKGNDGVRFTDGTILTYRLEPYRSRLVGAVVEDVASRPNQSSQSTFNFGYSTGIVIGVLQGLGIRIQRVPPGVWKMLMGCTASKKVSRIRAKALFPVQAELFVRAKDDGRAEAALLAKYGEKFFVGVPR